MSPPLHYFTRPIRACIYIRYSSNRTIRYRGRSLQIFAQLFFVSYMYYFLHSGWGCGCPLKNILRKKDFDLKPHVLRCLMYCICFIFNILTLQKISTLSWCVRSGLGVGKPHFVIFWSLLCIHIIAMVGPLDL